jgi:MFS transporter, DHA1 family, multidrug resistance protein
VPAVAPLIGTGIIAVAGWRGIFIAFMLFSVVSMLWLMLRQPETLLPAARRPFRVAPLVEAFREVLSHRVIVTAIAVQTLCFGALFGTLSSTQQIFDETFGMAASFPLWFAGIALAACAAGLINARLVGRVGMRRMVSVTLLAQVVSSAVMVVLESAGLPFAVAFGVYLVWTTGVFFGVGLTLGNLNALALEPVGHIAGMASSVVGAISTVLAVVIAVPLGLAFDGTAVPLAIGVAVLSACGYALMRTLPGR